MQYPVNVMSALRFFADLIFGTYDELGYLSAFQSMISVWFQNPSEQYTYRVNHNVDSMDLERIKNQDYEQC